MYEPLYKDFYKNGDDKNPLLWAKPRKITMDDIVIDPWERTDGESYIGLQAKVSFTPEILAEMKEKGTGDEVLMTTQWTSRDKPAQKCINTTVVSIKYSGCATPASKQKRKDKAWGEVEANQERDTKAAIASLLLDINQKLESIWNERRRDFLRAMSNWANTPATYDWVKDGPKSFLKRANVEGLEKELDEMERRSEILRELIQKRKREQAIAELQKLEDVPEELLNGVIENIKKSGFDTGMFSKGF